MRPTSKALVLQLVLPLALASGAVARADDDGRPIPTSDRRPLHAVSLYGRGLFAPAALLHLGLDVAPSVTSGSFGASYTYRRGTLDIVTSIDYSAIQPPDGNFLGAGKNPLLDTHYVHFDGLNLVSIDVAFYWVKDLHPRLAFFIGGGIGLGLISGDIYVVNTSGAGCMTAAGDPEQCHAFVNPAIYTNPAIADPAPTWTDASGVQQPLSGDIAPSDKDFQRKLDGLKASQAACLAQGGMDCRDTAEHPYYHKASERPAVMIVLNLQIGFKIKVHRHFNINISGGFRDGLILGGGPEYVF